MVVKEDADTVGFVLWQHLLGAPCFRAGFCSKTIIPDSEEHPPASSRAVPKDVLRWIRAKGQSAVAKIIVTAIIGLLLLFLLIPALQAFGRRLLTSSEEILIGDEVGTDGATSGGRVLDLVTLLPPDRIPAILNPQFVSAFEAGDWMEDDEQVLGLSIEGEHRAYAIKMLSQHEIVNDVVGGKPVAVTW